MALRKHGFKTTVEVNRLFHETENKSTLKTRQIIRTVKQSLGLSNRIKLVEKKGEDWFLKCRFQSVGSLERAPRPATHSSLSPLTVGAGLLVLKTIDTLFLKMKHYSKHNTGALCKFEQRV